MREKATALVLLLVLGFYSATIGWRGVELIRDGRMAAVLLGIAVVLLPVVLAAALWPLVRLARDGSRMMAHVNGGGAPRPQDARWRAELAQAESCRLARDRQGEQRHYRAAVRAWRAVQASDQQSDQPSDQP